MGEKYSQKLILTCVSQQTISNFLLELLL